MGWLIVDPVRMRSPVPLEHCCGSQHASVLKLLTFWKKQSPLMWLCELQEIWDTEDLHMEGTCCGISDRPV